jgi:thiamine biosynthesis protein ThiS
MQPSSSKTIEIVVNGEQKSIPEGLSVIALLEILGIDPERVAIEFDRRILRRPLWDEVSVLPGAKLEIVQFVGGG